MRFRPFVPPRRFLTSWLLACLFAAAALPGCSPEAEPEETYLGDFWRGAARVRHFRVTRVDHGDGVYEDTFRQIVPPAPEGDCEWRINWVKGETTYRGLIRISEYRKYYQRSKCEDWYEVGELHDSYDYLPYTPRDIFDGLMSGEVMRTPIRFATYLVVYRCARDAEICDRDHSLEIIDESRGSDNFDEDSVFYPESWVLLGERRAVIAGVEMRVLAMNSDAHAREWYDPEREVKVMGEIASVCNDPLPDGIIEISVETAFFGAERLAPGPPRRGARDKEEPIKDRVYAPSHQCVP